MSCYNLESLLEIALETDNVVADISVLLIAFGDSEKFGFFKTFRHVLFRRPISLW